MRIPLSFFDIVQTNLREVFPNPLHPGKKSAIILSVEYPAMEGREPA